MNKLSTTSYTTVSDTPRILNEQTSGYSLFHGPGQLDTATLLEGWKYCIDMFAVQFLWWESDVKIYLKRLCLNDATITFFLLDAVGISI